MYPPLVQPDWNVELLRVKCVESITVTTHTPVIGLKPCPLIETPLPVVNPCADAVVILNWPPLVPTFVMLKVEFVVLIIETNHRCDSRSKITRGSDVHGCAGGGHPPAEEKKLSIDVS